ncbi:hypothetical protein [Paenochrobactrum glaciei]|uniref:hypothetical protein n=1 Tax=Paenochrobactrum glaciei TaxID=486407 RepID=UPI0031D129FF
MASDLPQTFVDIIAEIGDQGVDAALDSPWGENGLTDLAGMIASSQPCGLGGEAFIYGYGYGRGAVSALRLARVVLSDPIIKGRETEAIGLIERGFNHSEILSALRAAQPASDHACDAVVVPFPSRR